MHSLGDGVGVVGDVGARKVSGERICDGKRRRVGHKETKRKTAQKISLRTVFDDSFTE
jgi:hypothetical protein